MIQSRLTKGIILAGGMGSRLYPLTRVMSKQLLPVYDKPMVYYPLSTLIENGIREICLIAAPEELPRFYELLGDGSAWGVSIRYHEQTRPEGIAQAFLIAESFIGQDPVALILGDNIFHGGELIWRACAEFESGATVFSCHVKDPERYGIVEVDHRGRAVSVEEKPSLPKSSDAITGLYLFDQKVVRITRELRPSARGELEIAGVISSYLERGELRVQPLHRGVAWFDAGTSSSLHEVSLYIRAIEERPGIKIGCPEEAAFRRGFLSLDQLENLVSGMPDCEYREYLRSVISEARGCGR
jgi:glucose-1-phosphate thymidylyltransferase